MFRKRSSHVAGSSLRSVLIAAISALVMLGLVALGLLLALTVRSGEIMDDLRYAMESVRNAESLQVALLAHSRRANLLPRNPQGFAVLEQTERSVREHLREIEDATVGPEEERLIATVKRRTEAYLASRKADEGAAATPEAGDAMRARLDLALMALEDLVAMDMVQARASRSRAESWDRVARAGATAVVLIFSAGAAGLLAWLWQYALRPMLELARAIENFAGGDRSARAPSIGSAEMRTTAAHFNAMAGRLERERENQLVFLSSIAHDLRNPLSALELSALLIERSSHGAVLSPEIREASTRILRQVSTLDRMVGDLLDATRIEAGRLELRLCECDVREIVRETVEPYAVTEDVELVLRLPDDPQPVQCDPLRLGQVLQNLISNAIKYSPPRCRVEVWVTHEGDEVMLTVKDDGIGIEPDEIPHIFEPFRRTDTARNHAAGAGLGLSVSGRIVSAHGGRIDVESEPGRGSTFCIRIPCGPDREASAYTQRPGPRTLGSPSHPDLHA